MNLKKYHSQRLSTLILLASLTLGGNAMAGEKLAMLIDIETDSIHIEELDISHLTSGDTETIYTEDGRVVDVMRTERGVEIFIDGEPLNMPFFEKASHPTDHHQSHQIMLTVECDSENDADCAEGHLNLHSASADDEDHQVKHIVIIKETIEEEDEI